MDLPTRKESRLLVCALVLILLASTIQAWHAGRWRRAPRVVSASQSTMMLALQQRLIDPNSAGADVFQVVPGIGPQLAERLVAHRTAHGLYRRPADFERVPGIGPVTRERLAAFCRWPTDP